jgi:signal transduction histidine kinase/HD-like signal output (HDOD) protein
MSADITATVRQDAALSARLLTLADSVTGRAARRMDLRRAVDLLGQDAIRSLALDAARHPLLLYHDAESIALLTRLWVRSQRTARVAHALAALIGYSAGEEAYLAGLLHNLGQLMLIAHAPMQYCDVLESASSDVEQRQIEWQRFGTDYCRLGAHLIGRWHTPSFLDDALLYQAEPTDQLRDTHPLLRIVHVARALGSPYAQDREAAAEAAQAVLNVQPEQLAELAAPVEQRLAEAAQRFELRLEENADEQREVRHKLADLAERVRVIALLDGVRERVREAVGAAGLDAALCRCAELRFGIKRAALLCYAAEHDHLSAGGLRANGDNGERALIAELTLPVTAQTSLPAQALATNRILHSDTVEVRVVDRQLLGLLNAPAMLCVPLVHANTKIGVLVLGVNRADRQYLEEQQRLLDQFARRVALALAERQQPQESSATSAIGVQEVLEVKVREVVHETRNPLTTIKNYLRIFSERANGNERIERELKIVNEEIGRVDSMLQRLADLSQDGQPAARALDVNQTLTDLTGVFEASRLVAHGIELKLDLDPALPPAVVSRDRLKQVLTNLIGNADEAMPEGGVLTIRTRADINVNGRMYVEIAIMDNGPGIAPEIMHHLFERTQSTKAGHAGLGLHIVKTLIDQMQGFIACHSASRQGTEFRILLPIGGERDSPAGGALIGEGVE